MGPDRRTLGVARLTVMTAAPIRHGRAAPASASVPCPERRTGEVAHDRLHGGLWAPEGCSAVGRSAASETPGTASTEACGTRGRGSPWHPFRVRHGIQVRRPAPGKSRRPTATRERLRCFHGRLRRGYSRFDHGHDRPEVGGSVASGSVMTVAKSGVDDLRVDRDHSRI